MRVVCDLFLRHHGRHEEEAQRIGATNACSGKEAITAHRAVILEELRKELEAEFADVVRFGDSVAIRASGGSLVCAEKGGPTTPDVPFVFTARPDVGPWESFKVERGE